MAGTVGRTRKPTQRLLAALQAAPGSGLPKMAEARGQEPPEVVEHSPTHPPANKLGGDSVAPGGRTLPEVPASAVTEPAEGFFTDERRGKCLMFVLAQWSKGDKGATREEAPEQVTVGLLEKRRDTRKPEIWVLCCEGLEGEDWQLRKLPTDSFGPWAEAVTRRPHGTMDWKKSTDIRYLLGWPKKRNGERFKSIEAWPDPAVANNAQAFAVALSNVIEVLKSDKWTLDIASCPSRYLFTSSHDALGEEDGADQAVDVPLAAAEADGEGGGRREPIPNPGKEESHEPLHRVTRRSSRHRRSSAGLGVSDDPLGSHSAGFADAASTLLEIAALHHAAMQKQEGSGTSPAAPATRSAAKLGETERPQKDEGTAALKSLFFAGPKKEVAEKAVGEARKEGRNGQEPGEEGGTWQAGSTWELKGRRTSLGRFREGGATNSAPASLHKQEQTSVPATRSKHEQEPEPSGRRSRRLRLRRSPSPPKSAIVMRLKLPPQAEAPPKSPPTKKAKTAALTTIPGANGKIPGSPASTRSIIIKSFGNGHDSKLGEQQQQQPFGVVAGGSDGPSLPANCDLPQGAAFPQLIGAAPHKFEPLGDCPGLAVDHTWDELRLRWVEKDGARAISAWLGDVASRVLPVDPSDEQPRREQASFRMLMAKARRKVLSLDAAEDEELVEAVSQCIELAYDYNASLGHVDAAMALAEVLRDVSRQLSPRCQR